MTLVPRAALVWALAVGCGGEKPRAPQEHVVKIHAMQFDPARVEVNVGDSIVWMNEDIFPHTVTASGTFDSGELGIKQQWHYTVRLPGEQPYGCTFHPTMRGLIVAH